MKRTILVITTFVFIFSLGLFAQQQTLDGGYIIAGSTRSYTNGSYDFLVYKLSASGQKQWRKNYGGSSWDYASMIKQTSDGGYVVVGYSASYGAVPGDTCDFLVYKLDASGNKQWRKAYGGVEHDHAYGIIQTSDGGYLVIGWGTSYIHGPSEIYDDFLVYKLSASGQKQWRKNYGGWSYDFGVRAVQTSSGGYVIFGSSESYSKGAADFLAYEVTANGTKMWRRNFGGEQYEEGSFIRRTSDGGYILCGTTYTYIHEPSGARGTSSPPDILVYKLNSQGVKVWRKNYGGTGIEKGYDIRQTSDGGYIFCGLSESYSNGEYDMLVYRVDAAGAKQWRKNYGGENYDESRYIVPCSDGGYLLYGFTETYTNGSSDLLVYKIDASGAKQWRKNYGGYDEEWVRVND